METYIKGMTHTLSQLTGQAIEPLDFSDDRLEHLLKHVSKPRYWQGIEQDVNEQSIAVYASPQDVLRCDATTVSGDPDVTRGEQITAQGLSRDPVRSSHSHGVKASGRRWLAGMLRTPRSWAARVWRCPV